MPVITIVRCPRCRQPVYAAEQVLAGGKKWHRLCFKCGLCKKSLNSTNLAVHEGDIFCKQCYARLFGIKGVGFGMGAGTLAMDAGEGFKIQQAFVEQTMDSEKSRPPTYRQQSVSGSSSLPYQATPTASLYQKPKRQSSTALYQDPYPDASRQLLPTTAVFNQIGDERPSQDYGQHTQQQPTSIFNQMSGERPSQDYGQHTQQQPTSLSNQMSGERPSQDYGQHTQQQPTSLSNQMGGERPSQDYDRRVESSYAQPSFPKQQSPDAFRDQSFTNAFDQQHRPSSSYNDVSPTHHRHTFTPTQLREIPPLERYRQSFEQNDSMRSQANGHKNSGYHRSFVETPAYSPPQYNPISPPPPPKQQVVTPSSSYRGQPTYPTPHGGINRQSISLQPQYYTRDQASDGYLRSSRQDSVASSTVRYNPVSRQSQPYTPAHAGTPTKQYYSKDPSQSSSQQYESAGYGLTADQFGRQQHPTSQYGITQDSITNELNDSMEQMNMVPQARYPADQQSYYFRSREDSTSTNQPIQYR